MSFIGVDFGSKRAGTTVLAYEDSGELEVIQSIKGEDADKFLLHRIEALEVRYLFIDAPLSIPKGLFQNEEDEVFYRKADRQLKAMSPMFLGGLTSRAVALKKQLAKKGVKAYEVYQKALVEEMELKKDYKKDLVAFQKELELLTRLQVPELRNWHQADAILAWYSGARFLNGAASSYGDEEEGMIYV